MALTEATQEAVWLKAFLSEIGEMKTKSAVNIYEDNQGSIALAKDPEFHKRTKNIDIRYHFVREKVEDGQVVLEYCSMKEMLADLMTKSITAVQFDILRSKLLGMLGATTAESSGSVVKKAPRPAAVYRRAWVQDCGYKMGVDVAVADWLGPVSPAQDSDYAFAMDTASTTTSRINKFDGTNFLTGEFKLERCTTTLDQSTFKRKSRKALAIICLAMEDLQLPLVRSANDAYDAWSRLEGHFEKKGLANKLFLRRRYFTTMMGEDDDVLEHINKVKPLAEQLDTVGAPVSEDDLVIALLASLSESYQFLITALESRADSPQRANVADDDEDCGDYLFSVGGGTTKSSEVWLVESGATQHMTYSIEYMKNYKKMTPVDVHLADNGVVQTVGSGDIVKTKHRVKEGVLTKMRHVPKLSRNLFSTKKIKWQLGAREGKGLFKLCMNPIMLNEANVLSAIVKKGYGVGINVTAVKQWELCGGCALGKQTRVSYMSKSPNHANKLLEGIHSDSEVTTKFAAFVAPSETQTGGRVRTLRVKQVYSDNSGEGKSREMAKFCRERGIVQKFTPPYTPQLNGVTKRKNRTLVGCARCMLEHAGLSKSYWGGAMMTAMFFRNRCPTRATSHGKSPHQVWTGKKPLLSNLKVFGCHAYVTVPKEKRTKFDARPARCRFLENSEHEKVYLFEESKTGRVLVSRGARFMEDVFDGGRRNFGEDGVVGLRDEVATDHEEPCRPEQSKKEEAARDEDSSRRLPGGHQLNSNQ
ncbi:Integrase catalytic core protein [Phytophthora palmivora]|uniref:Integrase catalytic core protein n=1 Tax=Phytophthora palmivora TaxID=4796 RepID=A0A2P4XMR2_9STRA|nr:Integrase catalytic core protein [Phytophthora palmivora]